MDKATLKSVIPKPDAKADCTLQVANTLPASVQPCEAASWGYFRAAKMNSEQKIRKDGNVKSTLGLLRGALEREAESRVAEARRVS